MSERMTAVEAQAELDAEDRRPSFVRPSEIRALREVVELTRERDEARARIARYVAARDVLTGAGQWNPIRYVEAERACDAALAALRETPAGEGEQ